MDERADDRTIGQALDDQTDEERGEQTGEWERRPVYTYEMALPGTSHGWGGWGAFTFETE